MLDGQAVVTRVIGDRVWLKAVPRSCQNCKTDCANLRLNGAKAPTDKIVSLATPAQFSIGERVIVSVSPKLFINASVLLYLIPLLGLLVGALVGDWVAMFVMPEGSEGFSIMGGLLGLFLTLWCLLNQMLGLDESHELLSIMPLR